MLFNRLTHKNAERFTTPLEARHLLARQNSSNVLKLINRKIAHSLKRNSVIQIKFYIELLSHILAAQNISLRQTDDFREGNSPFPTSNALRTLSKSRASKFFELNSRIVKYLIAVKIPDRRLFNTGPRSLGRPDSVVVHAFTLIALTVSFLSM